MNGKRRFWIGGDSQITMDNLEGIRGFLHRSHRLRIKVRRLESIHLHL